MEPQDMHDEDAPAYAPLTLERLVLPSGGWVSFADPEDLTGADVKRLMKALDAEGQGTAANQFYDAGMALLVEAWELSYAPGLQVPKYAAKNKAAGKSNPSDRLTARDYRAICTHLSPVLKELTRGGDDEDDESPR